VELFLGYTALMIYSYRGGRVSYSATMRSGAAALSCISPDAVQLHGAALMQFSYTAQP